MLQDLESFAPVRRGHCYDYMLVIPNIREVYLRTRALGVGVNVVEPSWPPCDGCDMSS